MRRRGFSPVDIAVPLLAAAVIAVGIAAHGGGEVLPLALGVAAGLSLLARRRAPATTLAVAGALTLVLLAPRPAAGVAAVAPPAVAMYSLGLRRGTPAKVVAAAAALTAIVVVDALHHG